MTAIKQEKRVKQETIIAHVCDSCKKREDNYAVYDEQWYDFSSSHGGWGNDSIDSFVYFDACSPECFISVLKKQLKDLESYKDCDAEIADMPYAFAYMLVKFLDGGKNA